MLLRPRNAAAVQCENLIINVDNSEPNKFYSCHECSSLKLNNLCSSVPDTFCSCGRPMNRAFKWGRRNGKADGDGVFVRGRLMYIITDDLNVALASTAVLKSLFKSLSIEDASMLEERILELCPGKIASLLWRSLSSKNPLTDLYFSKSDNGDAAAQQNKTDKIQPQHERDVVCNSKEIQLKLVLNSSENKVLYAEVGSDMVDCLFSFLTFPLGLLIKHANYLSKGCIVNLYKSVESSTCMKSDECKSMLLSPKLAAFHGCSSQLLEAEELPPVTINAVPGHCMADFKELNPKLPTNGTQQGGGYANEAAKFIVTDNLCVTPLSLTSSVRAMNEQRVSSSDLVEREATLGLAQALDLLRAAFTSQSPLTDVFAPGKRPGKKHGRLGGLPIFCSWLLVYVVPEFIAEFSAS